VRLELVVVALLQEQEVMAHQEELQALDLPHLQLVD
jgi:hypothetical protein